MKCPKCGGRTAVIDSRPRKNQIFRRRECLECGFRFNTWESYEKDYNKPVAFIKRH